MSDNQQMKPLSYRQAQRCEEAREPVCKCRCGGRLHGAKRSGSSGTTLSFFETLPEDDPHYIPSAEAKAAKKAEEKRQRDEARQKYLEMLYASRAESDR